MKSILVISNDSRIDSLIGFFQPLLTAKISTVTDYSQGFKEVFAKRPAVVFLQSEIAGVQGVKVAIQLKGLLRNDSPQLILLRESPKAELGPQGTFDEKIDLFQDSESLNLQFRALLEKLPSIQWRSLQEEVEVPEPGRDFSFSFENEAVILDSGEPLVDGDATAPEMEPVPAAPEDMLRPAAAEAEAGLQAAAQEPAQNRITGSQSSRDEVRQPAPEKSALDTVGYNRPDPALWNREAASQPAGFPWLLPVIVLLAGIVATAWYLLPLTKAPSAASAGKQVSPAPSGAPKTTGRVPAVIAEENLDVEYSWTHPGWERYLDSDHEYLVFREQGRVKVYQVIARADAGLKDTDIAAFLKEAAGGSRYTLKTRTEQAGYLLESGTTESSGEILLYRSKQTGAVKAMVVTP